MKLTGIVAILSNYKNLSNLKTNLIIKAKEFGFDGIRISKPELPNKIYDDYLEFIEKGYQGEMNWMEDKSKFRLNSNLIMNDVKSVIVLALNYGPKSNPLAIIDQKDKGSISVYAQGSDYHLYIKKRLKMLASWLVAKGGGDVKVFVDTAPILEKPFAQVAGIGWQGKHTNIVSKDFGSWLFLGEIFTSLDFDADIPEEDHCGSCSKCLDICPTKAFVSPYKIDARKCISYLTIEYKGHIPLEFRALIGNRIYGCDDCLAVCPWNKFATVIGDIPVASRPELVGPFLRDLMVLDNAKFRNLFSGSPIKRIGRDRFIRNVLIAVGNSGINDLEDNIIPLMDDYSTLVRAMSVWAMSKLNLNKAKKMRPYYLGIETDSFIKAEWLRI